MNSVAAIHFSEGEDIDRLLIAVADKVSSTGLRIGGLVQVASGGGETHQSESVSVVDLSTGKRFDIWEPRGRLALSCRLNETGLGAAEAEILKSIHAGIELLILNRFGRAESHGRGLTQCFAAGLSTGVAILTAVRPPFHDAWDRFHGGLATSLAPDQASVMTGVYELTRGSPAKGASGASVVPQPVIL